MNCDEIVSGLILEFRRGTLIMVVLAQLNKPMQHIHGAILL